MSGWERFVETFFKPAMIAQYWPDILKGVLVTLQIATAVVITGLALGLLLASLRAYRIAVLNAAHHRVRRCIPRPAAAGR